MPVITGGEGGGGGAVTVVTGKKKTTSSPQPSVTQPRHQYLQKGYRTPTLCEAKVSPQHLSLPQLPRTTTHYTSDGQRSASILTAAFPSLPWDTGCEPATPPHRQPW